MFIFTVVKTGIQICFRIIQTTSEAKKDQEKYKEDNREN